MTFDSIESWARRDNIPLYTEEWKKSHISFKSLKDARTPQQRQSKWIKWLFWFCVVATAIYPFIPTVGKAETIDTPVLNAPDKVQEATYCAQALIEGKEVSNLPSMKALINHCKKYGV